jgi:gluconolactonase
MLAEGLHGPEGPAIGPDGLLYVVEMRGGRVSRVRGDGTVETFATPGDGPNGLAFAADGSLYVCNNGGLPVLGQRHTQGRIERINREGEVARVLDESEGRPLQAPNDLVFDRHGNLYFTDPIPSEGGSTRKPAGIGFLSSAGEARRLELALEGPNGIAVTDDGGTLLVCETGRGRVHAYPIEAPGVLGPGRVYCELPEGKPDGCCLDAGGYLIVCGVQSGKLFVFPPGGGAAVESIEFPDLGTTNACFGGDDFRTLFVTLSRSGRVATVRWPREGMRLFPDR